MASVRLNEKVVFSSLANKRNSHFLIKTHSHTHSYCISLSFLTFKESDKFKYTLLQTYHPKWPLQLTCGNLKPLLPAPYCSWKMA